MPIEHRHAKSVPKIGSSMASGASTCSPARRHSSMPSAFLNPHDRPFAGNVADAADGVDEVHVAGGAAGGTRRQ
jgi:hypothetical protein